MKIENKKNLSQWMKDGEYLPDILKDFHDQKDLFKAMHAAYSGDDKDEQMPSWVNGHIYTIDWFLWYMGRRGYTLQKNRSNVDFDSLRSAETELYPSDLKQSRS